MWSCLDKNKWISWEDRKKIILRFPWMKNYENQTGKSKTGLSVSYREASISVSKKMYLFKDTFLSNDIIFY